VLPLVLLIVGLYAWRVIDHWRANAAIREKGEAAAEAVGAAQNKEYDIDATIRYMSELDRLMAAESRDYLAVLENMAAQKHDRIAPELVEARAKLLRELTAVYIEVSRDADRELVYQEYRGGFAMWMSSLRADLVTGFQWNPDEFKKRFDEKVRLQAEQAESRGKIRQARVQFVDHLSEYMVVYNKYKTEWDEFCRLRDQAYLHAAAGRWEKALSAADAARAKSFHDRESILLRAAALSHVAEATPAQLSAASGELDELLKRDADFEGTALFLQGVLAERAGDTERAQELFELANTRFPRQFESYHRIADLYDLRTYLRHSDEGQKVLHVFRSMATGSGAFSPRIHQLVEGATVETALLAESPTVVRHFRDRIRDHQAATARLEEARAELGDAQGMAIRSFGVGVFWIRLFEPSKLEKAVREARFPLEERVRQLSAIDILACLYADMEHLHRQSGGGTFSSLSSDAVTLVYTPVADPKAKADPPPPTRARLTLHNASDLEHRNVAIVLAIRYTDMNKGSHEFRLFPTTAPALAPNAATPLGEADLSATIAGQPKSVTDIVDLTAIAITDDEVFLARGELGKE